MGSPARASRSAYGLAAVALAIVLAGSVIGRAADHLTTVERLGKALFFDQSLSARNNQSCASCHDPESGWVGGIEELNEAGAVYEGSIGGRFGNRKPPSAAYATTAPNFRLVDVHDAVFSGGNFWDGRATGNKLGSAAADQAQGPFLNPLEQALPDAPALVGKVCAGNSAALFRRVWGADACANVEKGYGFIALSIAAYEGSAEVNRFNSKYDAVRAGAARLTPEEERGLDLFAGKAHCTTCHPHNAAGGAPPLFTDFTFDNIGVPRNPSNPFYANADANPDGRRWVDPGLGGFLAGTREFRQYASAQMGKHRVPTLRNVDVRPSRGFVKSYGHNGYFKSLEAVVHFYNTRDVLPTCSAPSQKEGVDCWPKPEVQRNLATSAVGNLGLTEVEEREIVAFLATLSDGFTPR